MAFLSYTQQTSNARVLGVLRRHCRLRLPPAAAAGSLSNEFSLERVLQHVGCLDRVVAQRFALNKNLVIESEVDLVSLRFDKAA